jgi:hypothetical protein
MGSFALEDGLVSFMNGWRGTDGTYFHKTPISYGES